MKCGFKKTVGKKWITRYRSGIDTVDIVERCENDAIYNVSVIRPLRGNKSNRAFSVCELHKHAIEKQAKEFGWGIFATPIQGDPT